MPLVNQTYDFIDNYFLAQIKNNPVLKDFENDLGLGLISKSLEFKINRTLEEIQKEIRELYYPQYETTLLAQMMYKVGYLRFKKPLEVYADVVSDEDVLLPRHTRFSDGVDVYYLPYEIFLPANVTTKINLTLQDVYKFDVTVDEGTVFFKIPTNYTYKDLVGANIFRGEEQLVYSQNFVKMEADYTYEIIHDGTFQLCVLLENKRGLNIQKGDNLTVELIISSDTQEPPENLNIIESGFDMVSPCSNVTLKSNYKPYMSLDEISDMLRYGRKNIGDICLNEDYRQFILQNFAEIYQLKVWQEKEEEEESGTGISHINKVFLSYIKYDGTTGDIGLDTRITQYVQEQIYGKEVVIRDALIFPLSVTITIETNDIFDDSLEQTIKNNISGYYDDIHEPITNDIIYGKTFKVLSENLKFFSLTTFLSDKGAYENRKYFKIHPNDITITFSRF